MYEKEINFIEHSDVLITLFFIFQIKHPRGVCVDNKGRIIVVECKVMRVIIFDQMGNVLNKFGCSKHLEFPNGVVVNDRQEIFISDNRAHCVKVFNYEGTYLRQIGGEGKTTKTFLASFLQGVQLKTFPLFELYHDL